MFGMVTKYKKETFAVSHVNNDSQTFLFVDINKKEGGLYFTSLKRHLHYSTFRRKFTPFWLCPPPKIIFCLFKSLC